jgi:hypothetical protein
MGPEATLISLGTQRGHLDTVFLASDEAVYITGADYLIGGARTFAPLR